MRRQLASSFLNHHCNQIDTGNLFRHTVLYLEPRVNFQKIKVLCICIEEKLNCASRPIINRFA